MYFDISIPIRFEENPHGWTQAEHWPLSTLLSNQAIQFGTHVDSQAMLFDGGLTIDQLEIGNLNGNCQIIKIPDSAKTIELKHIKKHSITPGSRVIFHTVNSNGWKKIGQPPIPIGINEEAGLFLADRKLKLVGIDGWSVDSPENRSLPIHQMLLQSGSVILESLFLDHVHIGNYKLICLPILFAGSGIAPCRAVLKKNERL